MYIKGGFGTGKKTITVFIDLTITYDKVWRKSHLHLFVLIILCIMLKYLLKNMLINRHFEVHVKSTESRRHALNSSLP